jgi:hypothetical protein
VEKRVEDIRKILKQNLQAVSAVQIQRSRNAPPGSNDVDKRPPRVINARQTRCRTSQHVCPTRRQHFQPRIASARTCNSSLAKKHLTPWLTAKPKGSVCIFELKKCNTNSDHTEKAAHFGLESWGPSRRVDRLRDAKNSPELWVILKKD